MFFLITTIFFGLLCFVFKMNTLTNVLFKIAFAIETVWGACILFGLTGTEAFVGIATLVFGMIALIWQKDDTLNMVIKMSFIMMTIWGVAKILGLTLQLPTT